MKFVISQKSKFSLYKCSQQDKNGAYFLSN